MPTLLDSFVLELKLDPSQFTESQRKAADELRKVENAAKRSAGNIEKSGVSAVDFFRSLENPISSLRKVFENLSSTTQTSGSKVEKTLTVAQRNYDAVMASIKKTKTELNSLGSEGKRTGSNVEDGALAGASGLRMLGLAGLTAFASITALDKLMGAATDTAKTVFGVGLGAAAANVPIEKYSAISQALLTKGVPEAETQGWLSGLAGLQATFAATHNPAIGMQLSQLGAIYGQSGININPFTDTDSVRNLKEVARVMREFPQTAKGLQLAIGLGAAPGIGISPAGAKALHEMSDADFDALIAKQVAITKANTEEAAAGVEASADVTNAWNHLSRVLLSPVWWAFEHLWADILNSVADFASNPIFSFLSKSVKSVNDLDNHITGRVWNWLTGGGGAKAATGGAAADGGIGTPGAAETARDTENLNKISWNETKNHNVPNAQGSGAFGPWQFTHSTWRSNAPYAGIDLNQYPTAQSAPISIQRHAALVLMRRRHGVDWDTTHGGPMPVGWYHGDGTDAPSRAAGKLDTNPMSPSYGFVTGALDTIRQSSIASSHTINNHHYGDSNIGDVTINTQATDGAGVMAAWEDRFGGDRFSKYNTQTAPADAGLS